MKITVELTSYQIEVIKKHIKLKAKLINIKIENPIAIDYILWELYKSITGKDK